MPGRLDPLATPPKQNKLGINRRLASSARSDEKMRGWFTRKWWGAMEEKRSDKGASAAERGQSSTVVAYPVSKSGDGPAQIAIFTQQPTNLQVAAT
eukprot:225283-Pleurochrysis_carterae.AAC.3